jgi:hypothetical protein
MYFKITHVEERIEISIFKITKLYRGIIAVA